MCLITPPAPEGGGPIWLADSSLVIAGGHHQVERLHLIDSVRRETNLKRKQVRSRISACVRVAAGLAQVSARPRPAASRSIRSKLSPVDWEIMLVTACCLGLLPGQTAAGPVVMITGDWNLARISQAEFGLAVFSVTRGQSWSFVSTDDLCARVATLARNRELWMLGDPPVAV